MKYYNEIGVKNLYFNDSTFNKVNFDIFLDGLISINNKIEIEYVNISFESLKLYQIKKMYKAGFKKIFTGIEYIHPSLQKSINKKMPTIDELFSYLDEFKKYGIEVVLYYIIGQPGQTDDIFKEELELLIEIDKKYPNISFMLCRFSISPKSYIEKNYKNYNIKRINIYDDTEKYLDFKEDLDKMMCYYSTDPSIEETYERIKMFYKNMEKI